MSDLIDRTECLKRIEEMTMRPEIQANPDTANGLGGAWQIVNAMPSATPAIPHIRIDKEIIDSMKTLSAILPTERTGHWIEKEDFNGDTYYDCSECGESFCLMDGTPTDNLYNYCPNCGARMDGDTE